jgi:hypothetical protein
MDERKRSPEDILNALDDGDIEDEVDRVAALTSTDVDRELASAGEDPGAIGAGAHAAFERGMHRRAKSLHGGPRRPHRGKYVRSWIGVAAVATSIGFAAVAVNTPMFVALLNGSNVGVTKPPDSDQARAAALRAEASAACARGLMEVCRARLDDARTVDPGGEDTAEVRELRKAIEGAAASRGRGDDGGD